MQQVNGGVARVELRLLSFSTRHHFLTLSSAELQSATDWERGGEAKPDYRGPLGPLEPRAKAHENYQRQGGRDKRRPGAAGRQLRTEASNSSLRTAGQETGQETGQEIKEATDGLCYLRWTSEDTAQSMLQTMADPAASAADATAMEGDYAGLYDDLPLPGADADALPQLATYDEVSRSLFPRSCT